MTSDVYMRYGIDVKFACDHHKMTSKTDGSMTTTRLDTMVQNFLIGPNRDGGLWFHKIKEISSRFFSRIEHGPTSMVPFGNRRPHVASF